MTKLARPALLGFVLHAWLLPSVGEAAVVSNMALGAAHTCALHDDGKLKCFGANDQGQLGLGDLNDRGGEQGQMASLPFVNLGGDARQVSAGGKHTCALLQTGAVKCWGANDYGQLGLGDTQRRGETSDQMGMNLPAVELGAGRTAVKLSLGERHSCALLDDQTVKCWGNNTYGQLGQPDENHRGNAPDQMGDALPPVNLGQPVIDVAAGGRHTCFLLQDRSVKCLGDTGLGQLGDGGVPGASVDLGTGRTAAKIYASFVHSCAELDDGSLKCWGFNGDGRLGLGDVVTRGTAADQMGDALPAVQIAPGQGVQQLQCGFRHCCAVLDANTLKCFGVNLKGALGLEDDVNRGTLPSQMGNDLPFVDLGRLEAAKKVFVGEMHTCVVLVHGRVKCFGDNGRGQLGLGDRQGRGLEAGTMGDRLPVVGL
jgi:alpha-tubulin suppressor-like RCC1 family protein